MPHTGLCANVTCDKELTQLYECHCCNSFICLNHLLEHVEKSKRTQERLDGLRNELISVLSTLKTIVERKGHELERDKQLVNQANSMLDTHLYSIDELQRVFEQINLTIASNRKDETVLKVEPTLSDEDSQRPKSPVYTPVHNFRDQNQGSTSSHENRIDVDGELAVNTSDDRTTNSIKDEADDEGQNEILLLSPRILVDRCQIPLNDVLGLTHTNHSISLRSKSKADERQSNSTHTQRLFQRNAGGQYTKATNLLSSKKRRIDRRHKFPCPLSDNMVGLFEYRLNLAKKVGCQSQQIIGPGLLLHLIGTHGIPSDIAKPFVKNYKEYLTEIFLYKNTTTKS